MVPFDQETIYAVINRSLFLNVCCVTSCTVLYCFVRIVTVWILKTVAHKLSELWLDPDMYMACLLHCLSCLNRSSVDSVVYTAALTHDCVLPQSGLRYIGVVCLTLSDFSRRNQMKDFFLFVPLPSLLFGVMCVARHKHSPPGSVIVFVFIFSFSSSLPLSSFFFFDNPSPSLSQFQLHCSICIESTVSKSWKKNVGFRKWKSHGDNYSPVVKWCKFIMLITNKEKKSLTCQNYKHISEGCIKG